MRPYLIIFSTVTIDGRISSKTGFSKLSCPYDLRRLHELRHLCDAVMVGANTVIIDDPSLRLKYYEGKDPDRIIVDGLLRSPITARVFNLNPEKTVLVTSKNAPKDKIEHLMKKGIRVIIFESPVIDMKAAMEELWKLGYRKIMVEGGGILNWSLISSKVVDELRVTFSPYIFGKGRSVMDGEGFSDTTECPKLRLTSLKLCECSNEIHAIYKIDYEDPNRTNT